MARRETALAAGWNDNTYEGDWRYVADLIDQCGTNAFRKVKATLFIHSWELDFLDLARFPIDLLRGELFSMDFFFGCLDYHNASDLRRFS